MFVHRAFRTHCGAMPQLYSMTSFDLSRRMQRDWVGTVQACGSRSLCKQCNTADVAVATLQAAPTRRGATATPCLRFSARRAPCRLRRRAPSEPHRQTARTCTRRRSGTRRTRRRRRCGSRFEGARGARQLGRPKDAFCDGMYPATMEVDMTECGAQNSLAGSLSHRSFPS